MAEASCSEDIRPSFARSWTTETIFLVLKLIDLSIDDESDDIQVYERFMPVGREYTSWA